MRERKYIVYSNGPGHMTEMATTSIYGKKIFSTNQKAEDHGTWYVALGMWGPPSLFNVCSNDDARLTVTNLTSRSNLLPNAFKWEMFLKS